MEHRWRLLHVVLDMHWLVWIRFGDIMSRNWRTLAGGSFDLHARACGVRLVCALSSVHGICSSFVGTCAASLSVRTGLNEVTVFAVWVSLVDACL
eukprot:414937-Amphidinium_carterae.2